MYGNTVLHYVHFLSTVLYHNLLYSGYSYLVLYCSRVLKNLNSNSPILHSVLCTPGTRTVLFLVLFKFIKLIKDDSCLLHRVANYNRTLYRILFWFSSCSRIMYSSTCTWSTVLVLSVESLAWYSYLSVLMTRQANVLVVLQPLPVRLQGFGQA
jgi:hypothetical protein